MSKSKRIQAFDYLKGFGMIMVILGHVVQMCNGPSMAGLKCLESENWIILFTCSFHMPLFILVSGYLFFKSSEKYSFKDLMLRRCVSLLRPIMTFTILAFILNKGWTYGFSAINPFYLWFLWAVIFCVIGTLFVKFFAKDSYVIHIFIVLLLLFIPDFGSGKMMKWMYPYFVLGYYVAKYDWRLGQGNKSLLIFLGLILYFILMAFFNYNTYIYTTGINVIHSPLGFGKQIAIDVHRFVVGIVGSIVFGYIFIKVIDRFPFNYLKSTISNIGKESLGMYVIQSYFFLFLGNYFVDCNYSLIRSLVLTVLLLVLCLGITKIIRRSKILTYVVLGS